MLTVSSCASQLQPSKAQTPTALKAFASVALGALAASQGMRAAAATQANPIAPGPAPAAPGTCPAQPLPCHCVAAPPAIPSAPIASQGTPEVFVTTPSPYLDEGIRVIVAQRPLGTNATSLFAMTCIDSLGDNALSSIGCTDSNLGINQTGLLSPIAALEYAMDPQQSLSNGPNQVLLDYTGILTKIHDAPCTHLALAQGLAYSLSDDNICEVVDENNAIFNNTYVVTHFQEALRDALNEPLPAVCYENIGD